MKNKNEINFCQNKMKKDELIALINYLNEIIKSYYNSTKQIILESRENSQISNLYIKYFEKNLYAFIQKAKEIFNKMKHVQKKNLIQQEIEKSQSYNFCNNNFFYYSNALTTENENYYNYAHNINRLMKDNEYRKPSNNSPNTNSNFNLNYINYTNNNYHPFNAKSKTPRSVQNSLKNLIIENSNNSLKNNHVNFKSKKLEMRLLKSNKEELLKKLLFMLKNLKRMNGKIFYDTNEARIYKKLIYTILGDIGKLVEIMSKEQNENEKKSLSERQYIKPEKFMGIYRNNKINNSDRNYNSRSPILINNKTFNDINRRNIINDIKNKIEVSKSQKIKSNNILKIIDEKSEILSLKNQNHIKNNNIKTNKSQSQPKKENIFNYYSNKNSLRNLLFKDSENKMKALNKNIIQNKSKEKKGKNIILIDKGQQTENIFNTDNYKVIEEKSLYIESDNSKIIQKEKIIKDLENKIQTLKNNLTLLKDDLSSSNNQLSFFKSDNEKQNKQISDMSKEISLMKKLIDDKDKIDLKNKEEKKEINNKNKGNLTESYYELQTDIDKMSIRYELLKIDYNKQKNDLKEKEQLINNYNMYINTNDSKNVDEQVCQLAKKHKDEIDKLNKKYTRDIINLKINSPNCFSAETHQILIDKKYSKYNLHWYLLTVTSAEEKDYENTYWVSENEIKATLDQFNKFKTEEELEKETVQDYLNNQQKLIKRIENNENYIIKLESQLKKNENNNK